MEPLRSRVRAFLAEVSPPAEVRRLMEDERGYDLDVWLRLAADHDLLALEGWPDRAVVLEEAGRVLLCAPYLATVTAAPFLPDDVRDAIAGGVCIATLALAEASGHWDAGGVRTRAVKSPDGGWRLEGEKWFVVDGCAADVLVVAARPDGADHVSLYQVDAGAPGVHLEPLSTVDPTRRQARVRLSAVAGRPLDGSLDRAVDMGAVALAAEQVGGAERALEMALEHAGRRVQFGRPIGSFQAVKHLCAEMLLDLESARAAALHAASAVGTDDLAEAAAVAKVCCSEAYVRIATDSLHVHGGLGFTWDHDAHLYLRRARSSLHLFGDPRHHRERLARHLGL
ncbi:MAG TPA: acyl-CoA dehydrogenase [Acidimicrobiales bacterium]|nr:acyl-CoA dehydrogenase [Acidimicrobiales bacterium]